MIDMVSLSSLLRSSLRGIALTAFLYISVKAEDTRLLVLVGNKYGYINNAGQVVIETIYDDASEFTGAFASVTDGGKRFIIDRDGKRRSNGVLENIRDIGLKTYVIESNSIYRVESVDSGEVLLENISDLGFGYGSGHLFARIPGSENLWFHLIENPTPFLTSTVFSMQPPVYVNGLLRVCGRDGHYDLNDRSKNKFDFNGRFENYSVVEISDGLYTMAPDGSMQSNPHLSSFDYFENNYLVTELPSKVDGKYHLFFGSKAEITNSTNRIALYYPHYVIDGKIYSLRDHCLVLSVEEIGLSDDATIHQVGNGYAVLRASGGQYYYKYLCDRKSILHGPYSFVAIPPFQSEIILICEKAEKVVELPNGIKDITGSWTFRDRFGVKVYDVGLKTRYNFWSQFRPVEE